MCRCGIALNLGGAQVRDAARGSKRKGEGVDDNADDADGDGGPDGTSKKAPKAKSKGRGRGRGKAKAKSAAHSVPPGDEAMEEAAQSSVPAEGAPFAPIHVWALQGDAGMEGFERAGVEVSGPAEERADDGLPKAEEGDGSMKLQELWAEKDSI